MTLGFRIVDRYCHYRPGKEVVRIGFGSGLCSVCVRFVSGLYSVGPISVNVNLFYFV